MSSPAGGPGPSLLGIGDNDTMQAPISTRTPDTPMTLPAACIFSEASGLRPISTSKERDVESGLDYFNARYYTSDLARYMTPDWAGKPTAVPYAQFGACPSPKLHPAIKVGLMYRLAKTPSKCKLLRC